MTVTNKARTGATRMATSRPLEALTRIGFVGYGLLHLAVAWLAIQLAVGHQPGETDQSGAFQTLAAQPLGRFLLAVVAIGLAAMAVWKLLLAAVGHRAEQGAARAFERIASLGRVIVYTALAWTAYRIVAGTPSGRSAGFCWRRSRSASPPSRSTASCRRGTGKSPRDRAPPAPLLSVPQSSSSSSSPPKPAT
jgi:Domain of Unknown Function (DUF1206)